MSRPSHLRSFIKGNVIFTSCSLTVGLQWLAKLASKNMKIKHLDRTELRKWNHVTWIESEMHFRLFFGKDQ